MTHWSQSKKTTSPAFPEDQILDFFLVGLRRGASVDRASLASMSAAELCRAFDVRGFLYFLLLCFGGLRASEPLHLFLSDVSFDFLRGSGATVLLRHPIKGMVADSDGVVRERWAYLLKEFGRSPRNTVTGSTRVGWKKLMMDEAVHGQGRQSRVYFVVPEIGHLFWHLHRAYVSHARPRGGSHPYYFVSAWANAYGEPWSMGSAIECFERALRRIKLEPCSATGLCMHAFRHGVALWMRLHAVPPDMRQLVLHQNSIESQLEYGRPGPDEVVDALRRATEGSGPGNMSYLETFPNKPVESNLHLIGAELAITFLGDRK